jgi:hypothetical protein
LSEFDGKIRELIAMRRAREVIGRKNQHLLEPTISFLVPFGVGAISVKILRFESGDVTLFFHFRLIHQDEEHRPMPVYGNASVELVFARMRVPPFSEPSGGVALSK